MATSIPVSTSSEATAHNCREALPNPSYITHIEQVKELTPEERAQLGSVTEQFAFRSNTYYQSLIDWNDPMDPIRRIIMPETGEMLDWGELDASSEASFTVAPGVEHKYPATALLLTTDMCGGYCRFCFRKRLFMPENDEILKDVSEGVEYIRAHQEINNVLFTGGDPLILSTRRLTEILTQVTAIDHIRFVRIGTKMPAFNPARILHDPGLLSMIRNFADLVGIYVIAHFNHPRELTPAAVQALKMLQSAGAVTANQTPLIRGVNDHPAVLAQLFTELCAAGTPPYYVFQCRPTLGNAPYSVPVEQAYRIFAAAQAGCSGLAKRARFIMSHVTGKIEVVGLNAKHIFLRYHEAVEPANVNKIIVCASNPSACWFDDYEEACNPTAFQENCAGV